MPLFWCLALAQLQNYSSTTLTIMGSECPQTRHCHLGEISLRLHGAAHRHTFYSIQCPAVHFSAVRCSAEQCSAVQCSAEQCSAVQCSAVVSPGLWDLMGSTQAKERSLQLCGLPYYTELHTGLHCTAVWVIQPTSLTLKQ